MNKPAIHIFSKKYKFRFVSKQEIYPKISKSIEAYEIFFTRIFVGFLFLVIHSALKIFTTVISHSFQ